MVLSGYICREKRGGRGRCIEKSIHQCPANALHKKITRKKSQFATIKKCYNAEEVTEHQSTCIRSTTTETATPDMITKYPTTVAFRGWEKKLARKKEKTTSA